MWTEVRSAMCFICISSVAVFFFYSGLVTDFFVSKWERRCVCIIYNKIDLARWIPKLIHVQSDSEFYLLLNTFSLVRGCSALWCTLVKHLFCSLYVYIKHRACKYLDYEVHLTQLNCESYMSVGCQFENSARWGLCVSETLS